MAKCKNCKHLDYAENVLEYGINKIPYCFFNEDIEDVCEERECFAFEVITNADRIRSMTDEELAKFLEAVTCETHGWCDECKSLLGNYCHGLNDESNSLVQERLKWLKSEVGCE